MSAPASRMPGAKPKVRVFKFGGTSVGDSGAIRRATQLIQEAAPHVVAVVSASSGSTDLLLGAAKCAQKGQRIDAINAAHTFSERHTQLIRELIPTRGPAEELLSFVEDSTRELLSICEGIFVLRELSDRTLDAVVSRGERVMARLFASLLAQSGTPARYVDATQVLCTELRHGSLWPDLPRCQRLAQEVLQPILEKATVPVVPGYIGAGPKGEVVTLGRGGSDFSAAIMGRSLNAESVTLYKEVDGLMTADPKWVPQARVVPELHYREAAELAFYGAKILHPRTMIPLKEAGIPLFIKNTFNPAFTGTRVAGDVVPGAYPVKALTAFPAQALLAVEGSGMMGVPGMAARTFGALSRAGHSVSMISQASSEASICLMVPEHEAEHARSALEQEFSLEMTSKLVEAISIRKELAVVAVVGLGMAGTPGIAARVFGALARSRINIIAIAQGSSELNITMTIRQEEVPQALQALHQEFRLDRIRALPESQGKEASLVIMGVGQIGRALTRQLGAQQRYFEHDLGINLKTVALLDRSGIKVQEEGFSPDAVAALVAAKAHGAKLVYHKVPTGPADSAQAMRDKVFPLPLHTPILVDLTAAETAPLLMEAVEHGFHLVLANKKPLCIPQEDFEALMAGAAERRLAIRYEATVGAGLPIMDTLQKLKDAGDEVRSLVGCLSGTLGYLMTQMEDGVAFSTAVRQAHGMGYTEPDPREDLSGADVARKALILARTLGRKLEFAHIHVEPLFPAALSHDDPAQFMDRLRALDAQMGARVESARADGRVLRFVASLEASGVRVGLEAVPKASPMGQLRGTDNQVVMHTRRYSTQPLVVSGPGAGADVTAAGVLNDIMAIVSQPPAPLPARDPPPRKRAGRIRTRP